MKKKIRGQLLVMLILGIVVVSSIKIYALSPPYLSLKTSQDVITNDNAVLHAELVNFDADITGFEIFIYKDDILVKSGFKKNTDNSQHINIVFDLKKDLSIVLTPDTTYKYTIYARSNSSITEDMYKQTFYFKTKNMKDNETQETTSEGTKVKVDESRKIISKKPVIVKIKSAKNRKIKAVVLKYKKTKNAKKYQVQYSASKKFKNAVVRNTKKLTYIIKKLKKGKTYYIRVRGLNGTQKGRWSKMKKVTVKK